MGSCLSKKGPSSGPGFAPDPIKTISNANPSTEKLKARGKEEESLVKKEIFLIKHRKSHDRAPPLQQQKVADAVASSTSNATTSSHESSGPEEKANKNVIASNINFIINGTASSSTSSAAANAANTAGVRTSSCTKEEVDAILIQCGRLSRSSSGKAASGSAAQCSRKYSGSKRSYDFDHGGDAEDYADDDDAPAEERLHRERNRQSVPSSPQGRRRRTPSRERDQRSSSKERSGGGSRRVSRSPGRRSGNTSTATNAAPAASANGGSRPGKMVSVPATVSSLVMDKISNNGGGEPVTTATTIKRIAVKRNVGEAGSRSTASPRARSPARTNGANESTRAPSPARNENPRAPSPARVHANGSNENPRARSPARTNSNGYNENPRSQSPARGNANGTNENQQPSLSRNSSRKAEPSPYRRNPLSEIDPNSLAYPQTNYKADGKKPNVAQGANHKTNQVTNVNSTAKEVHILEDVKGHAQMTKNVAVTSVPQTLTRSRSSRRSQDLDLNPSYTSLLLEDIQNFHQKNTPTPTSFSLPPCVTKACSIVEAVADLNSCTSSNFSNQFNKTEHNLAGKKRPQPKDPFVESEVIGVDDLMEPSLHKYVTVTRGGNGGGEIEEEESSGSNSFVGGGSGQQHWGISSSSWEPNSADSTDRWTSRSMSESGREMEEARRGFSGKRRDLDHHQHAGIGRGRTGGNRGPQNVAVAAST